MGMNVEEIRVERKIVEERQEENRFMHKKIDRKVEETAYLWNRERQIDDRILTYFQGKEDCHFFEDMAEELRIEERRMMDCLEEAKDEAKREQRALEDQSEELYEQELTLLREEATSDGKDGAR